MNINGINYEMKQTDSKMVSEFGHDKDSNTLAIIFKYAPNTAYVYSNVSYQKHTPLNHAESFGAHFHAKIRPFAEQYPFEKFDIA